MAHFELHVPEELIEVEEAAPPARPEKLLELGSVLVLALAVVATAWSGYHAARWSGEESRKYTEASGLRVEAAQETTLAGQARIDDLLYFNGWLDAYSAGDKRLAKVYERRLRPEFRPAFDAWIAQRPFSNPNAIPGPLYVPEYHPAALDRAEEINAHADEAYREGIEAKHHDDAYILSTVFFAAVLFFASVSMRLEWWRLRVAVFSLGAIMLAVGLGWVVSQPIA